ncbi:MAG: hypothetical protein BWY73_01117 [candidate division TA06 bacterium ADurb.Bin417]|uniref:Uncharacterized protein n=1 Tax=candidate division TA06 bacterium ADurb.Bin417 TaxID=1852828 RepID=A0A1V5MEL5_UNCT6|nr:MAG: hypothetical protein BWY73_01117 [candidate division TA06 bacterium ADurb.Bin417]
MAQLTAVQAAQVFHQGPAGGQGQRPFLQAESGQAGDPEVFLERPAVQFRIESPVFQRAQGQFPAPEGRLFQELAAGRFGAGRKEALVNRESGDRFGRPGRVFELVGLDGAAGGLDEGQAESLPGRVEAEQAAVLRAAFVNEGAGGDHPHHLPLYQAARLGRVLGLFADGHLEAGLDQATQVAFERVVGQTAHRDPTRTAGVPRGKHQVQDRRGLSGVLVEHLVEIAQPEEKQAVRVLALQFPVLPEHRRKVVHDLLLYLKMRGKRKFVENPVGLDSGSWAGLEVGRFSGKI